MTGPEIYIINHIKFIQWLCFPPYICRIKTLVLVIWRLIHSLKMYLLVSPFHRPPVPLAVWETPKLPGRGPSTTFCWEPTELLEPWMLPGCYYLLKGHKINWFSPTLSTNPGLWATSYHIQASNHFSHLVSHNLRTEFH